MSFCEPADRPVPALAPAVGAKCIFEEIFWAFADEPCSFAEGDSVGGGGASRVGGGLNLNFFEVPPAEGEESAGALGRM